MKVYKIFAEHENKMVSGFSFQNDPQYSKNGLIYYKKSLAEADLQICQSYKNNFRDKPSRKTKKNDILFVIKTYEMTEI